MENPLDRFENKKFKVVKKHKFCNLAFDEKVGTEIVIGKFNKHRLAYTIDNCKLSIIRLGELEFLGKNGYIERVD